MTKRFAKQAEFYARYRPDYPDEMYEFIFRHLKAQDVAWDCATGSGQVAKKLADRFNKVIATDISREQLRYAPQVDNIRYKEAAAENSGLPANHFDLITVAQAIHWFDFEQFYQEVQRVAKDGALLAVIGYGMIRINEDVDPILNALYEDAFSVYYNENRKYLDQRYHSIPFPFEEIPAPSFQNKLNWTLDDLEGFFNSWSAIQKIKSEKGYNLADKTMKKISEYVADRQNLEVTFDVFMRLGKVEK